MLNDKLINHKPHKDPEIGSIYKSISKLIKNYLSLLDGGAPMPELYSKVIFEVEKALILETMKYTSDNQLKAASILGINRNTLRSKLQNLS